MPGLRGRASPFFASPELRSTGPISGGPRESPRHFPESFCLPVCKRPSQKESQVVLSRNSLPAGWLHPPGVSTPAQMNHLTSEPPTQPPEQRVWHPSLQRKGRPPQVSFVKMSRPLPRSGSIQLTFILKLAGGLCQPLLRGFLPIKRLRAAPDATS